MFTPVWDLVEAEEVIHRGCVVDHPEVGTQAVSLLAYAATYTGRGIKRKGRE